MRTAPALAATALAAALLLTACSDEGGGSGSDDDTKTSAKASQDSTACQIDKVAVEVGPANAAPAAGDTGSVPVTITNSAADCTLDGLPTVDLSAGDTSTKVPADPAADSSQKLTLAKGQALSFTITYVRGESGAKSLAAKTGRFSLPGATATHSFAWSYGDVALKGDGREPDASVSGFQQVGD